MNLAKIFERFKNNYESLEIFENPLRSFYIFYISSNVDHQRAINKFDLPVNLHYKSLRG